MLTQIVNLIHEGYTLLYVVIYLSCRIKQIDIIGGVILDNILELQKINFDNNEDNIREFSPSVTPVSVIGLSTVSNDC